MSTDYGGYEYETVRALTHVVVDDWDERDIRERGKRITAMNREIQDKKITTIDEARVIATKHGLVIKETDFWKPRSQSPEQEMQDVTDGVIFVRTE